MQDNQMACVGCGVLPYLSIPSMTEQAYTDHNVALKCKPLLCLHKLIFEASAAAKGNDFIFAYHA